MCVDSSADTIKRIHRCLSAGVTDLTGFLCRQLLQFILSLAIVDIDCTIELHKQVIIPQFPQLVL